MSSQQQIQRSKPTRRESVTVRQEFHDPMLRAARKAREREKRGKT